MLAHDVIPNGALRFLTKAVVAEAHLVQFFRIMPYGSNEKAYVLIENMFQRSFIEY